MTPYWGWLNVGGSPTHETPFMVYVIIDIINYSNQSSFVVKLIARVEYLMSHLSRWQIS